MAENQPVLLSVDDEQSILKALKRSLRKLEVEVLTTTSGEEALKLLEERTVDVVLSDMRMPGVAGPQLLKRAAELQPSASRIVLTGYADVEDTKSVINEAGVAAYLVKPWDDEELRRLVAEGIRVSGLKRENRRLEALTREQNEKLKAFNEALEEKIAQRTEELATTNKKLAETLEELKSNHQHMVGLVASIAALPNQETQNSTLKVQIALALGKAIGLSEDRLHVLEEATRLHRLGYVGLPHRLRETPLAALSEEQHTQFEQHPIYAQAVLLNMESMQPVSDVLYAQQELYDGSGFPEGLAGSAIPLEARLLAVARDYVDLQSGRITGSLAKGSQALVSLREEAERCYDPDVVKRLPEVLAALEHSEVALREVLVHSHALEAGMRLARDLTSAEGVLLLAGDTVLTESAIKTLMGLEKRSSKGLEIYVVEEIGGESV